MIGICSGGPAHHPDCGGDVIPSPPAGPPTDWHALRMEAQETHRRICNGDDPQHHPECPYFHDDPPAEPDTDWLMAWASGWLGGYATGYDHGHQDGEREYGESLAEALTPMRRAAAHGIDVALAREAWAEHQRRMRGGATA